MRLKDVVSFLLGVLLGVLALYYILWRTDGLKPGHLLARTTADWTGRTEPPPPLPTIPFPTPGRASPTPTPTVFAATPNALTPAAAGGLPLPEIPTPSLEEFAELKGRAIAFPLRDYRLAELKDTFHETRGGTRRHEALDILAPRGTPVLAVDDGKVTKLFTSRQGGLTVYQFDPRERFAYYYAHLDRYAEGLKEGDHLRRGDRIGTVGTTGNASPDTPHLHFAIFRLGPEKHWWEGTPVNPFPLFVAEVTTRVQR
jgi:murein DD-endopeptidase MepM/ murein hydrolase activator NlpD